MSRSLVYPSPPAPPAASPRHAGRFHNVVPTPRTSVWKMAKLFWKATVDKPAGTVPTDTIPVVPLTRAELLAAPDHSLYRLGHSTVLMKLRGKFWLTDPVFSRRASPVQWAGPKRFHAPPIAVEDLPPIEAVILSHNHYDHFDRASIASLAARTATFVTALGVGRQLVDCGVDPAKVRELDWWQSTEVDGVRVVATPAQHFSGRGLHDAGRSLWASWVILDAGLRVFFSGDSGYFDGFRQIGEAYGPFDLTLIENGAYDPHWPHVHMQPEETLRAHLDLRGRRLVPIHNGTFDLALHRWQDPFERIHALAKAAEVPLATPRFGERLDMGAPQRTDRWWEGLR